MNNHGNHLIVNLNDAITVARLLRAEGIRFKRIRKGYWGIYDTKTIDGLLRWANEVSRDELSIDTENSCRPGELLMIDKSVAYRPLERGLKMKPYHPPSPWWYDYQWLFGFSSMKGWSNDDPPQ